MRIAHIPARPRLLLLAMYPLDRGAWGPTVRISHLRRELERIVDLDVIAGYRGSRRLADARYALSGRLRGLDGIYVESSSFLPAEADFALLGLARSLGTGVLTYVRDAYQLYPEYYPRDSVKRRIGAASFGPMIAGLRAVSTRLAFPTAGLATAVLGDDADSDGWALLPPGAPSPVSIGTEPGAKHLLFVGDARLPAHGADRLIEAVGRARARGVGVELSLVARPGQEPPAPHPDWLQVHRAEGDGIHALLPDVVATVIPRPRGAYNDLALPIKLFDYLAYGRPLLVTDCREQARIVREADAGLVVDDGVDALADGIVAVVTASAAERERWSANATAAAARNGWDRRAASIVELLGAAA